ncbi:Hypothetical predicted protein [Pelobates cultripes]|uniref:Uncharacterized protein n=1 Tax=Pelobates cultripes TaxID=61616 RepID=A0AAD1S7H1_PELCU|nr:Hypothetical predicted protein [Pelobates cultripes]
MPDCQITTSCDAGTTCHSKVTVSVASTECHNLPYDTGCKNKKYRADKTPATADLLWRPVMVSPSIDRSRSSIETSFSEHCAMGTHAGKDHTIQLQPAGNPLIMDETLRHLFDELRRNIVANIGQFRDEINGVSAHLTNAEVNTAAHEQQITKLELRNA